MKSTLTIGISGQTSLQVGPGRTITLGGDPRATVFKTPSMIHLMEDAAREALRPHLEPHQESVGIDVQIEHTAATPPKAKVTAEATVTGIEKNVISFDVIARDPWGEIGRGTHRRAVINTTKFADRLADQKQSEPDQSNTPSASALPTFQRIKCSQSGKALTVTLNRPEKRNAMDEATTSDLEQLVAWLAAAGEQFRTVIIHGAGDTFCAGDDVGDLPESPDLARSLSIRRGELFRNMTVASQVFIAAIDGMAFGGGLVLASACDVRIASFNAKFALPEVKLGWLPNYGMGIIQSLIGRGRALELSLSGGPIDARQAEAIGLINRVVSGGQLLAESERIAAQICDTSPTAVSSIKEMLAPGVGWCDEKATERFLECLETQHARKNIERFRQ